MNSQILVKINSFFKNRLIELSGILLILSSIFLLVSIASYSPSDPNFIYTPENVEIKNFGGFYGSVTSDFLLQSAGLISFLISLNLFYWGLILNTKKKINNFPINIKLKMTKKIEEEKTKIQKLKMLYSLPKSIPDEIKTQVAKRIKEKKVELENIYHAPKGVITLERSGKWTVVQVVKAFLGMPIIPGR